MENIFVMLEDVTSGKCDSYTKNSITKLNSSLENMRKKSRDIYNPIDLLNNPNLAEIKRMLSEWELTICDPKGQFNLHDYVKVWDGVGNKFECELCKSLSERSKGNYNCKSVYLIKNRYTHKVMEVGSQCIKKFKIPVYNNGKEISIDSVDKLLDKEKQTYCNYKNNEIFELYKVCRQYTAVVSNNRLLLYNKLYKERKMDLEYYKQFENSLRTFKKDIIEYDDLMFSLYQIYENSDHNLDVVETSELYSEINNIHRYNIYDFSANNCRSRFYTFIPNAYFVTNNAIRYMGGMDISLMIITATKLYNELKSDAEGMRNIPYNFIYKTLKDINFNSLSDISIITSHIKEFNDYNKNYSFESISINDLIDSLIIILDLKAIKSSSINKDIHDKILNRSKVLLNIAKDEDFKKHLEGIISYYENDFTERKKRHNRKPIRHFNSSKYK